jgi:hypothetical protein
VVTGFFAGADGVNGVADHEQRLEWDHYFVVFDVITDEHEDGFPGHGRLRKRKE